MNKQPYFSIVIPTYNRPIALKKAIESCLAQTFTDFEIIVVDDGSTEADISSVVSSYKNDRIKYIKQENQGGSVARNTGIINATGKYIAFLDSDDYFKSKKLAIYRDKIEQLSDKENTVLYSKIEIVRESQKCWSKPKRGIRDNEDVSEYLMVHHQFIQTSTIVISCDLAKKTQFTPGLVYGQDTDFCIKIQKYGGSFVFIDEELTIWMDEFNENRVSNSRKGSKVLDWLDTIRPDITEQAYYCYRGFHIARMTARENYLKGLYLYFSSLLKLKFPAKLSIVAFLQVSLHPKVYRNLSNRIIDKFGN